MRMDCTSAATPIVLTTNDQKQVVSAVNTSRMPIKTPSLSGGFTLIELLVAISVMSLLAVLSWRGLDGMARAQAQTSLRADQILTLQAGLAQWKIDLDALALAPQVNPLDWDGRVLRITRRAAMPGEGLLVVAWMRRTDEDSQWLRWQSQAVRTTDGWTDAWRRAGEWAQGVNTKELMGEVSITPLEEWQIFYFRGNAWTNPMSSAGQQPAGNLAVPALPTLSQAVIPEGIRLVLVLPASQAISGKVTVDWVSPVLGGAKS